MFLSVFIYRYFIDNVCNFFDKAMSLGLICKGQILSYLAEKSLESIEIIIIIIIFFFAVLCWYLLFLI